ncbi:MAG: adenylate/guanylate cyclase domain-containing protein [Candidatus Dormiibacterota bacterium]
MSVLFADLVGFTSLSEKRDAEEVRELLTRYFDTCRALIGRYGGVAEKFIGDAVMAVWGAPLSHEDDAERAVRTALEMVEAVAALGAEVGAPGLRARAGVLTGEAAVTFGEEHQGMVAGDLVNTASRIQAEAEPGAVLVGDATRRATEAALAYEDAGERALKGRDEPVHLWRALRVVAGRGGALKTEGLEAPFVGRDRELRLMKDQFHACAEEHRARLISVVGIAGIGKSRLSWEFYKYIDGVADRVLWHRGRCLAYGEGVTYSALAEMVRMRAGIVEGEDPSSARAKLQGCLGERLEDPEERRWVEPRLAHLLALEELATHERADLFSAWRLFFERLAEKEPTVLVFEDMQWADTSLLEFVEYLLEWSRNHALYVVTLARPELSERHPTWGAGKRNFTAVFLEPLAQGAMEQLLDGLVPGLPDELREQILRRAEGVPLYAMETVRMLLDRGLLTPTGSVYRVTGPVEDLAVPESLHGLIAARLDGLHPEARHLLQDAAVLGKTFTLSSLAAVSGVPTEQLQSMLTELVRKEVLSLQADPRSPERGQYGFLQDLVRRVAYETLSKRDRKERHLAVARWLKSSWGGDEKDVVEVVASHYLEAYNLAPHDSDADELRGLAADVLAQAGERAASLAANIEAERYFEQASELVSAPARRAELHERAGEVAFTAGRGEAALEHFQEAVRLFEAQHLDHAAARVSSGVARVDATRGRLDEAVERLEQAIAVLAKDPPDADLAAMSRQLGTLRFLKNEPEKAARNIETALDIAETLWLPEMISSALNSKAGLVMRARHIEEALGHVTHALALALDNDLPLASLRAYFSLADVLYRRDRHTEALAHLRSSLALARRTGDRPWERAAITEIIYVLTQLGEWEEASEMASLIGEAEVREGAGDMPSYLLSAELYINRGQLSEYRKILPGYERMATSSDVQERTFYLAAHACHLRAEGRYEEALNDAEKAMAITIELFGPGSQGYKAAFVEAIESAFALENIAKVEELIAAAEGLRPGERPPSSQAHANRFRAMLAARRGEEAAAIGADFSEAEEGFRRIAMPFWLAVTQLEHAEWLASLGHPREAEALLGQSRPVFERLGARPWLDRLDRVLPARVAAS